MLLSLSAPVLTRSVVQIIDNCSASISRQRFSGFDSWLCFLSMPLPGWYSGLPGRLEILQRIIWLMGWLGAEAEAELVKSMHSCIYIEYLGLGQVGAVEVQTFSVICL